VATTAAGRTRTARILRDCGILISQTYTTCTLIPSWKGALSWKGLAVQNQLTYLYAPGNKQYLVVYSNGEQEWLTNEEITTGERLAISTADALCLHVMRSRRQRLRVMNLCSGNGIARAAIRKMFPNAHIVTVDANPQCHADFTEDVRTWEPWLRFKVGYFDIIWGSPPCNDGTRDFALADSIGQAIFSIIGKLQPQAWFVANPRGHLRDRPFMQPYAKFRNTCTYCKYGAPHRKETVS
jgi:hypothetical protein